MDWLFVGRPRNSGYLSGARGIVNWIFVGRLRNRVFQNKNILDTLKIKEHMIADSGEMPFQYDVGERIFKRKSYLDILPGWVHTEVDPNVPTRQQAHINILISNNCIVTTVGKCVVAPQTLHSLYSYS